MFGRLIVIAVVLASWSHADTLRLRNGSRVEGSFLGGTADVVRFSVNDQDIVQYARTDVAEIIFGSIGGPSAITDPPIDVGPDIAGAPFLRGANGYIPLERQISMMARSGGMYGMGGGGTVYRVQGQRSPVRVRHSDRIVFVVRLTSGMDPRQFQLFRLEPRMGYRQTQVTMGGTPPGLPVTINRVSDTLYEITPGRGLYPGEYAISPMNSNETYCFGVDY
ncbi:MAG TPA: hypothetical protein VKU19_31315 [Bryobacteraceae bacterium]|nr:hypothetical protein [Bryobacteraceae bacterium]